METLNINGDLKKLLLDTYKSIGDEKVRLPDKTKRIKKTVEVEEPVEKQFTIQTINYIPGVVVYIIGIILFFVLPDFGIHLSLYLLIFSIITGTVLLAFVKKEKEITKTVFEKKEKTIEEEIKVPGEIISKELPAKNKVISLGKINLKFKIVIVNGNKLVIPITEVIGKEEIIYPFINKIKQFKKQDSIIEKKIKNIPFLLDGETEEQPLETDTDFGNKVYLRGEEKDLNQYFQYTQSVFSDIKKRKLSFPLLFKNKLLEYFIPSNNLDVYTEADELNSLIFSEEGSDLEEFLDLWKNEWASRISLLNKVRIHSLQNEISPEFIELGQLSQYTSFNFYCPKCNKEIQEDILERDYSLDSEHIPNEVYFSKNTKCKFDPVSNVWKCPVCNGTFVQPIPVHRIMDELFMPVYDNLMEEHKVEREKHHSETRKKETEIRFKMKEEMEKVYFQHVTGLFELQENMDKLSAEIAGESEAINYLQKTALEQKNIQTEVINTILRENQNTNRRVNEYTKEVRYELEGVTEKGLIDYDEKMTSLSKSQQMEDERREKVLLETLNNGFNSVVDAQERTTEAIHENTKITKEGLDNVTGAVNENTKVANENLAATQKQTEAINQGFSRNNQYLKRNNGIQIAMAKKQGIELRDSPFYRLDKKISHGLTELSGKITGKSIIEIETNKEN